SLSSPTLSPRYSVMTAASESRNSSTISATASTFSGFAMALLPEVSRHRVKEPRNGKRPRHAGVEASTHDPAPRELLLRGGRDRAGRVRSPAQAVPVGTASAALRVEGDDRRSSVGPP